MQIANLRISSKIIGLVLFMGTIALGVAAYGGWSLSQINAAYSHQVQDIVPARIELVRATARINSVGYSAYKAMVYPGASQQARDSAKSAQALSQQAVEIFDRVSNVLPGDAAMIAELRTQVLNLDKTVTEATTYGLNDQDNEAKLVLARADGQIDAIVAGIRKLVDEGSARLKSDSEALASKAWWTTVTLIAASLAAIAAGVALALWLTHAMIVSPIASLRSRMTTLAEGDTAAPIEGENRGDEIGAMARAVAVFRDAAVEKMRLENMSEEQRQQAAESRAQAEAERQRNAEAQAAAAREQAAAMAALESGLERLAEGDLRIQLNDGFSATYAKIRDDFNATILKLRETTQAIVVSTQEVSNASAEISVSTTDLSQRTEEQAASLEETSASMEQIAATVKKNAENAQAANRSANSASEVAGRGGQVVANAVDAMARIEESSRKISDIIGVIDEIARQTNLLALNAAVEAARAGEAGRGFAVVASEVRSLAQRSSQAAKDIKDLIVSSNGQVKDGVDLVNKAGQSLQEIVESIKSVAAIVADIASASAEQAIGIAEVNKALTQMDEATQQNSALVEENAATAKTLEQQALSMNERVSFFRVDDAPARAKAAPVQRVPQAKPAVARAKIAPAPTRGPVGRMQTAVAAAFDADQDWQEF